MENSETPKTNKKFGGSTKQFFVKPKFARWKMFVQFYNGNCSYYSYDFTFIYNKGKKILAYKEREALNGMIVRFRNKHEQGNPKYRFANVFGNFTNDLSTDKKNYDHLICSFTPEGITNKMELVWDEVFLNDYQVSVRLNVNSTLQLKNLVPSIETLTQEQAKDEVDKVIKNFYNTKKI